MTEEQSGSDRGRDPVDVSPAGSFDPITGDGYAPDQDVAQENPLTAAYRQGFSDGEEWVRKQAAATDQPSTEQDSAARLRLEIAYRVPLSKAYLHGLLDKALQEAAVISEAEVWQRGYAAGLERGRQADNHPALNPLLMAFAIDKHTLAYGPTEPIHDGGTCSTDCAADIARRYADEVTTP